MSRKRSEDEPRPRRSPTRTVADASDVFAETLDIPTLPDRVPDRLAAAIERRVEALLYQLDRAAHERWIMPLEVRIVRDAHRAVLTAYELGLTEGEVYYARFRDLVAALGYERTDIGFRKRPLAR